MKRKQFQTIAQWVGTVTIAALCIYGLLSLIGVNVQGVSADETATADSGSRAVSNTFNEIPTTFNYSGVLREVDGSASTGNRKIKATLWTLPTSGVDIYSETFNAVLVRDGQFNFLLGDSGSGNATTGSMAGAFDESVLYLAITVYDAAGANPTEIIPRERLHAVPWALRAQNSFDGLPVGSIIDWVRPVGQETNTSDFPIPAGFALCDGIATYNSGAFSGETVPNLNGRYLRGTTASSALNSTYGADTHNHLALTAGSHNHQWMQYRNSDRVTWSYNAAGTSDVIIDWDESIGFEGSGLNGPLFSAGTGDRSYYTTNEGAHSHSVSASSHNPETFVTLKLCRVD